MSSAKASFLPNPVLPIPQPWPQPGCNNDPWPPPFIPPWPGGLALEALALRAAIRAVRYQGPALARLSPEAQEATISSLLDGLQQDGLLTAEEVDSLRGVSKGRAFTAPLFNPDGSPSLCGVLGRFLEPSPERSTASAILGAVIGAVGGAAVGGPVGAGLGALGGGVLGAFLE